MSVAAACRMSFIRLLLPELQSLVLSFLTPPHLLSTCTHICKHVTHSALTPSCFRTRLFLDERTIKALPSTTPAAFHLLTHATAVVVEYGDAVDEGASCAFFSPKSSRSLLHFTHASMLSIRYTDEWDFLNQATPFALLRQLLDHCPAGHTALPQLTALVVHSVPEYDDYHSFQPLVALQSLARVELHFTFQSIARLRPLLQLPELQSVVWWTTRQQCAADDTGDDKALDVSEQFCTRGITVSEHCV